MSADLDAIEANYLNGVPRRANWQAYIFTDMATLVAEVRRLRAAIGMACTDLEGWRDDVADALLRVLDGEETDR